MSPLPDDQGAPRREPWVEVGGAVLGGVGFAALAWLNRGFVTDDAWISLRYARHLADGLGLVWNPQGPPVEGYSNPLLVALEALAYRFGGDGLLLAKGLGVVCGLVLIAAVARLGAAVLGSRPAALAAVLTGLWAPLAFWSQGGLETLPAALSIYAATLVLAKSDGSAAWAGCLLAPLAGLRPEALALAGALALASEGPAFWRGARGPALRRALQIAGPALLVAGLIGVTRWVWFQAWVPNSVLYKTGTMDFGKVTLRFLAEAAPLLAVATLGLWKTPGRARLLAVPPGLYLAASPGFRDSVNEFSRFLLPTVPLLALCAAAGLAWVARRRAGVAVLLAMALLGWQLGGSGASPVEVYRWGLGYQTCKATVRTEAADWLAAHSDPGETYGIADAGLVPFRLDREVTDLFWLNSPEIQRQGKRSTRQRAAWLMKHPPDWLMLSATEEGEPNYETERAILNRPEFASHYVLKQTIQRADCGYLLLIYQHTTSPADPDL